MLKSKIIKGDTESFILIYDEGETNKPIKLVSIDEAKHLYESLSTIIGGLNAKNIQ